MAGTGIERDVADFMTLLNTAIDGAMTDEVLDEVKDALQVAIDKNVYSLYQPTMYKRRGEDMNRGTGALTDPDVMEHTYDSATKTLTVTDMAKGGDPEHPERSPRLLAPIIESGKGYTWTKSAIYHMQPFPRPFHEEAENMLADGSSEQSFEYRLAEGLRHRKFDAI